MDGVGIDKRLGSSANGGEESERADTSLNIREAEESSGRDGPGFKSSDGNPTSVSVASKAAFWTGFCSGEELLCNVLSATEVLGWLTIGDMCREEAEVSAKFNFGTSNLAGKGECDVISGVRSSDLLLKEPAKSETAG